MNCVQGNIICDVIMPTNEKILSFPVLHYQKISCRISSKIDFNYNLHGTEPEYSAWLSTNDRDFAVESHCSIFVDMIEIGYSSVPHIRNNVFNVRSDLFLIK